MQWDGWSCTKASGATNCGTHPARWISETPALSSQGSIHGRVCRTAHLRTALLAVRCCPLYLQTSWEHRLNLLCIDRARLTHSKLTLLFSPKVCSMMSLTWLFSIVLTVLWAAQSACEINVLMWSAYYIRIDLEPRSTMDIFFDPSPCFSV